jgi:hypothetical protein
MLAQPHLALLSVPTASLPPFLLTPNARRSVNGSCRKIGETAVDLRSPPRGGRSEPLHDIGCADRAG